jgi:hypothetical protein
MVIDFSHTKRKIKIESTFCFVDKQTHEIQLHVNIDQLNKKCSKSTYKIPSNVNMIMV